jgi:hypothetical protein
MTPFPTAGAVSLADHAQDFRALVFDAFDEVERKCAEELGIRLEDGSPRGNQLPEQLR